jgi:hypothetical protein
MDDCSDIFILIIRDSIFTILKSVDDLKLYYVMNHTVCRFVFQSICCSFFRAEVYVDLLGCGRPEDGDIMFLQNIGLQVCRSSQPRRPTLTTLYIDEIVGDHQSTLQCNMSSASKIC